MTTMRTPLAANVTYGEALQTYLADEAEGTLELAYEFGRRAVSGGVDLLEFAARHQEALVAIMAHARSPEEAMVMENRGAAFFLESLAPFAMTHRGYREVNATLSRTNTALQQEIAERRRAEEQVRLINQSLERRVEERTAELTRANRLKDEFLALVSHELRTPLTPIHGWVHLLRTQVPDRAKLDQALTAIERNLKAELQIVNDLLDVSAIINGKLLLKLQMVDPMAVMMAAMEVMQPAADAKHLRIRMALEALGPVLKGDPDRLQQVFWNLLSNAVKFTPVDGCIDVRLRRDGGQVEIAVEDTGIGVAPEFLPFVFDRFRQADSSTTRRYGGLGLGLALVRHIVELHGGNTEAASEGVGKGTTITIRLPIREVTEIPEKEETPPIPPPPSGEDRIPLRVLVVDDEADTRAVMRALLGQFAMEVQTAGTAAEAMALLESFKPDVMLADIGMPEENGFDLIKKVRALPPERGGQVPAVALTAFAMDEDRRAALAAGFQAHVTKPVDPVKLMEVVRALGVRRR
jgi:signal transduction histidine kinase/ActR/RegA family two-component response regulator